MTAHPLPRQASEPCRIPVPVRIPVRRPFPGLHLVAGLIGLTLAAAPASASRWEYATNGRLVDVEVMVDGSAAPLYQKPGAWDRRYFQAFRGRNYSLAVTNQTGRRVGVLISVDGLNVVSGERSHLSHNEAMYVLDPYERAVIRGWRTSLKDVRRFVFVDEQRSYAERTGQANGDMGWIRVLSFEEVRPRILDEPRVRRGQDDWNERQPYGSNEPREEGDSKAERRDSAAPSTEPNDRGRQQKLGAESFHSQPAPESNPGTGWGQRSWDPVQRTVFLAAAWATDQVAMRYEYASGLRALGIFPRGERTWQRERGELSFAKPPRW